MVIIVEKDRAKRVSLHQLFEEHVPSGDLVTVESISELLSAVIRVSPSSIWISSADQDQLTEMRKSSYCSQVPIYVMAASSLDLNPFLLKRCAAKGVFVPLRPYQIKELTNSGRQGLRQSQEKQSHLKTNSL